MALIRRLAMRRQVRRTSEQALAATPLFSTPHRPPDTPSALPATIPPPPPRVEPAQLSEPSPPRSAPAATNAAPVANDKEDHVDAPAPTDPLASDPSGSTAQNWALPEWRLTRRARARAPRRQL
ncbi:MAG TPA: hypothetical protein VF874_14090 [Mycobacterium sp.]